MTDPAPRRRFCAAGSLTAAEEQTRDQHSWVRLVRDRPDLGLAAGTKGVVVFDHASVPPFYEVEFYHGDDVLDTLAVETMAEEDLEPIRVAAQDGE